MSRAIGTYFKWVEKELGAANWRRRWGREERKEGRKEKKMRAAEDSRSCSRVLLGPQFSVLLNAEEGRRFRSIENEEGIISLPISNCGFD